MIKDPDFLMIDCVAGYHLNPWTCGIAKFNSILARRLDVPVVGIREVDLGTFHRLLKLNRCRSAVCGGLL